MENEINSNPIIPKNWSLFLKSYKFYSIICLIILIVSGVITTKPESIFLYYFGLVFFAAGIWVTVSARFFGIIFLFSHGGSGLGLMIATTLGDYLKSEMFYVLPKSVYIYLSLILVLIITATVILIIINVRPDDEDKRKQIIPPVFLLSIAVFLSKLLPFIIGALYRMEI